MGEKSAMWRILGHLWALGIVVQLKQRLTRNKQFGRPYMSISEGKASFTAVEFGPFWIV
jgi:hypothetical protein